MPDKIDIKALITFVDIRGFTGWSGNIDNNGILVEFVESWYRILDKNFIKSKPPKKLGDGAMIVREIPEKMSVKLRKELLIETLEKINKTNNDFSSLCKEFAEEEGTKIQLFLGWGIAKGPVKKINGDYIGANINKCARFCGIARPYGIVIDADDFPNLPASPKTAIFEFYRQTRLLEGIRDSCDVWVTKEIAEPFIPRENKRENPEVHVAGICFKKENGEFFILLGQRAENRKLYPSLYEGCGGQLANNELFHEGVMRHYKREYHIDIKVFKEIYSLYEITESNKPKIPGIRFLCEYISGTPSSHNHIPPTPRWFSEAEFKKIHKELFIPGLKDEISGFFDEYKKLSK